MPNSTDLEQAKTITGKGDIRNYSLLEQFFGHVIFEGHSIRIGLELSLCVLGYICLQTIMPWSYLGMDAQWASLYSWFSCCLLVVVFDLLVLCRSAHIFRRAYLLGLHKEFEKAGRLLEDIGPSSTKLIRLPQRLYHLYRAELAAHQGESHELGEQLNLAFEHGIPKDQIMVHRLQMMRAIGEVEACHKLIAEMGDELGESPEVLVEQVRTLIVERSDFWKAKKIARKIQKLADRTHFSGESCHRLASAYESVAMLWSGEAEDGLDRLNIEIELIRRSMLYVDTLRPVFSQLLLERSLYLATHKEPTPAVYDYTLSRALCSSVELDSLGQRVREELLDRFSISLGP